MKQLGWTSLDQAKQLVEAGLDPNTADMWWSRCTITDFGDGILKVSHAVEPCNISQFRNTKEDIPCWSLGKLIELMPKTIETKKPENLYFPDIFPASNGVAYTALDESKEMTFLKMFTTGVESDATLIDNMVSMICWLLENNYIKKGNKL